MFKIAKILERLSCDVGKFHIDQELGNMRNVR